MFLEIFRIIFTNRSRIKLLQKRLKIATAALEKLTEPLVGEWYADVAREALKEMIAS